MSSVMLATFLFFNPLRNFKNKEMNTNYENAKHLLHVSKMKQVGKINGQNYEEFVVTIDRAISAVNLAQKPDWHRLIDVEPIAAETGEWDGKRSDYLLLFNGEIHKGRAYIGILDGHKFCNFYCENDYELKNVTHFMYMPENPLVF